ncbi:MAG: hypothetical protein JRN39_01815 [Nitrososphaerota archaeon]|nr:hypothetical protein [Nitrososphaerota archaeon]
MSRTNITVDRSVFQEFSSQVKRQNKSLFASANESLLAVSKIYAEGGTAPDIYRLWRLASVLKQIDVITLPSDFVDELLGKLYEMDRASLLQMFAKMGSGLVGLLRITADDVRSLNEIAKDFMLILPLKKLKLTEADPDSIEIDMVGAGGTFVSAECTAEFITALLNGYGYTETKREIGLGTVRMWATRRTSFR